MRDVRKPARIPRAGDVDAVGSPQRPLAHDGGICGQGRQGIYSEKPCSTTIAESIRPGRHDQALRVVYQAGTQRRNIGNFILAADLCHSGRLGKLTRSRHTLPRNEPGVARTPCSRTRRTSTGTFGLALPLAALQQPTYIQAIGAAISISRRRHPRMG